VRSIARRTAENSTTAEDMLAHFQGRLDAFSRVQAVLTRGVGAKVDLASLIDDELIAHAARDGEQIHVEGPEISLAPKTAERLSLAIHELATNAVKHGALSKGRGRIAIRWRTEPDGGGNRLVLSWKESGVELDGAPRREGFGTELLLRSLPYDVQGETRMDFPPHGLEFELSMPLPPANGTS
jgi:two-component system CheB/CheR fusion protein